MLRSLASDGSESGVGFLPSDREDSLDGVDRNEPSSPHDAAVLDPVHR